MKESTNKVYSLDINGTFQLKNKVSHSHFHELAKKAAVIIGCHLTIKSRDYWNELAAYVASDLHRHFMLNQDKIVQSLNINIQRKLFIFYDAFSMDLTTDLLNNHEGSHEIGLSDGILVIFYYQMQIKGSTMQSRSSFGVSEIIPVPHHSWESLTRKYLKFSWSFSVMHLSKYSDILFTSDDMRMKYSPQAQQQQQKDRKSESDMSSVNATPARAAAGVLQRSASAASAAASQTTSAARRVISCRPLSTDMFAWMRVFRLAHMLQSVNC